MLHQTRSRLPEIRQAVLLLMQITILAKKKIFDLQSHFSPFLRITHTKN
jgi:hypothetical protein